METLAPRNRASLDPGDLMGVIYVGDHLTFLYTKYISSGPHSFGEEDLDFLQYTSIWKLLIPGEGVSLYQRDLIG